MEYLTMKRACFFVFAFVGASAVSAADAWRFVEKTNTAEAKTAAAVLSIGCEMLTPSSTVLSIQIAGPSGAASSDTEKVGIFANDRTKSIKAEFLNNAEGWKWTDSAANWQGGMFKHLESANKLKVTLMGQGFEFPTTGLASALQSLKKACN